MIKTQSNFIQRLFSVCLFAPLIIFAIRWSQWSYFSLFFYIIILAMLEFYKLIKQASVAPMRAYGIWLGLLCYTATFAYYIADPYAPLLGYGCVPFVLLIYIAAIYSPKPSNPFLDIAATFLAIFYIAIPCSMLHALAFFQGDYDHSLILGLLLIIWSQDIGAYVIGSLKGETKLFERISPKKTWEGVIGGAFFTLLASYSLAYFLTILPLWQWMTIAVITIATGTYGDLAASLLKRSIGVKNASETIPGHGGFLDRIDSLLLTIPAVVAFLKISSLWK